MEDVVERVLDLQKRKYLQMGTRLTEDQIPRFDLQDERELKHKIEKVKQYYQNWQGEIED